MSFFSELQIFSRERKKNWLLPVVFAVMLLGGLLVLIAGMAIAPFFVRLL